ncbi:TonB-dependent receptor [Chitinophaga pendula]|uniref:TonB-dependent receptor n=1 Tax=Chitinophaga TaxID=79328 RepID=UPI000BB01835|nr:MULTISPECIES: TonB-dependent receptor [Chitinophaga]ASZ13786.1 SusC/RagA family TonB-linked outer membrane protein [Chitinophaga sp. MD30]UCJ08594.1 TonB-dependent receptor [Chitinophaga pendula]
MKKNKLSGGRPSAPGMRVLVFLRFMKLTTILLLGACLQVSANAYSQQGKITINTKRMQLAQVLSLIEKQGNVRFVYSNDVLPNQQFVAVTVKDETVERVLSEILRNTSLTFRQLDKELIVIAPGATVIQNIPVKGKVTDSKGDALIGVSVQIAGTSRGTITGADGSYQIEAPGSATLVFSYIGYLQQQIAVNDRTRIDLVLQEDTKGLSEVVVVGYGAQKKVNLTGSVATVSAQQLTARPVTNVQNALQGLVPGLTVLSRPGDVGRDAGTITVRGRTNLSSPGPMVIIDGIPSSNRDLAALNPNDIENMSVLKDAASSAIYGSRAANGVILITTKKGTAGKMSVDLNASYGIQSPTRIPKYLGSGDYARLYNEALTNAGKSPIYKPEQIARFENGSDPDLYPNTDWYGQTLKKNPTYKDVQLGVSGSSKNSMYYLSFGYMNQESLVPYKGSNRYTVRLNTSSQVLPILNIGANVSMVKQDIDNNGGDLSWTELNRSLPTAVARHSDGSWGTVNGGVTDGTTAKNNVLRILDEAGRRKDRDFTFMGGLNGTLTPLKGLTIKGLASLKMDYRTANRFWSTMPPLTDFITKQPLASTQNKINEMQEKWIRQQEVLLQAYAEYEKSLNRHHTRVMVGASQESNIYRDQLTGRRNFPVNNLGTVGAGSSNPADFSTEDKLTDLTAARKPNGTYSESWAMRSFFGRINYNYDEKYLLEANLRLDLSSRFDPDYRKAWFPSVSAGWRLSEEQFMKDIKWIDNLKLRTSWGVLGNQNEVVPGNYYTFLTTNLGYGFDGVAADGIWQVRGVNRQTSWEKVYMTNVGVDATLWEGKLSVTADYFIKRTEGILLAKNFPATYGIEKVAFVNAGSTRNRGVEIMLSHSNRIGKDFTYDISVNVSKIKNTILSLGDDRQRINSYWIEKVGESVGSFFGYEAIGLFRDENDVKQHATQSVATRAGDIKYKDQNGDGKIDANDRVVMGNDVPWLNYGINLGMVYKGIDLNVITYGVSDVKVYLVNEASFSFFNGAGVKPYHLNRWTKDNPDPNAQYPRLLTSADGSHNYQNISSFWLYNGAYFRIRSITAGYTLPANWTKRVGMKSARIYIAANNPFTFMADKRLTDYDPEMASGRGGYPGVKTWAAGVNIKF